MKEWLKENVTMIPIYAFIIGVVIAWIISIRFIITGTSIVDTIFDLIEKKEKDNE